MSRIGLQTIAIPSGVTVAEKNGEVCVKGPKGELAERLPEDIVMSQEDSAICFKRKNVLIVNRSLGRFLE